MRVPPRSRGALIGDRNMGGHSAAPRPTYKPNRGRIMEQPNKNEIEAVLMDYMNRDRILDRLENFGEMQL